MRKCEYCGTEWGNHETFPGSGVFVGGVHWCEPMLAMMRIEDEVRRIKQEADPVWQAEQKRHREECAENRRKLLEALSALPGCRAYNVETGEEITNESMDRDR